MKKIKLSDEQKVYLKAEGKVVLKACPGSGKTTAIAYKIVNLLKNWELNNHSYQGIACLSFTNVAKDEIGDKFRELTKLNLPFPHTINTIDSFINQFISQPFAYLVLKNKQRIKIIEDGLYLDSIFPWSIAKNYRISTGKYLSKVYPPSTLSKSLSNVYVTKGKRPKKLSDSDLELFDNYAHAVKKWQMENNLFLFQDSERLGLSILKSFPHLGQSLIKRFPLIIIDEAQDMSDIQHAIIDELVLLGLERIELVGDPYQAIYEWRDARPDLFLAKYDDKQSWIPLDLSENRRSTQVIVDTFSKVRQANDKRILAKSKFVTQHPIIVYKYSPTKILNLVETFENECINKNLNDNWIVCRSNTLRNSLSGINTHIQPWKSPICYEIIAIVRLFADKKVKESVNRMRKIIVKLENPDINRNDLEDLINNLSENNLKNSQIIRFIMYLPSCSLTIPQWTSELQKYLQTICNLSNEYDLGIKVAKNGKNSYYKPEHTLLKVERIVNAATSQSSIQISNVHSIKGRTVDSTMLVISAKSNGQSICLKDICSEDSFPNEKKRLAYVAMSRPQHFLALAVPNIVDDSEIQNKLNPSTIIDIEKEISKLIDVIEPNTELMTIEA